MDQDHLLASKVEHTVRSRWSQVERDVATISQGFASNLLIGVDLHLPEGCGALYNFA